MQGHQAIAAVRDGVSIDLGVQRVAGSNIYVGVFKHAHPIELSGLHEIVEFLEIRFRFAGEADDETGA